MCVPPIIIGVLSAGLGFMQYQSQIAAQNKAIENANNNAIAQFNQQKLQSEANNFREQQQKASTELANETSEFLANRAAEQEIAAINLQATQAQEEAAIKKREKKLETLSAQGEILATGKGGLNIANLLADVDAQYGQFDWNTNRNLAFTGVQSGMDKRSANIRLASRKSTLNPYIERVDYGPARPILQDKVKGNTFLALASAGLQGASAGMNWHSGMLKADYKYSGGLFGKYTK
tara:strand:+ start:4298 stop:5002 length:705 start_codon:yes stop_codon:yes gene_type:complete